MNRTRLRKCVAEAAESYADDSDFELSHHVADIIRHFDESLYFQTPADVSRFVAELAEQFPECEWNLFSTTLALYLQDILAELPRQALPPLELSISVDGSQVDAGRMGIGGEPQWLQVPAPTEEYPACTACSEIMAFVCQIDSQVFPRHRAADGVFRFADAGCIYLFVCLKCGETRSVIQSH